MPVYHALGAELISRSEFLTRATEMQQAESFDIGTVGAGDSVRPFADIDFGKPLNILVRRVYTGRYPEKRVFSSRKPMLITSAIKDITTTSAAAQAVNMLKQSVTPRSVFSGPGAREEGTSLIYYSPAVASSLITISIQMVFDDFDDELFSSASQLFTNLAGVPIFVPAAGYLLGASSILKLAGSAGSALFSNSAPLNESIELDFSFGGGSIPKPGFWVLSSAPLDLSRYSFDTTSGLVEKSTGQAYSGDDPVVVLSLDGSVQPTLTNFAPLMASASLLGRFFSQKQGSEVMMDSVLSAMKLYNDFTYRMKAEELQQQMAALPANSDVRKKLQDQFNALNAGISETRLRIDQAMTQTQP
jgi:hypothetical protein